MVENNNNQEAANNNEEQSNQQNTNSNNPNNGGGGKKIVIGIDHGGMDDKGYLTTVAKGLEDCGNEVIQTGVSPNQEGLMQGHGADLAVFLTNGIGAATYWSFRNAIKAGSLPYTIFMSEGWYHVNNDPESPMASLENARKTPYSPEHDASQFMGGENSAQRQRMQAEGEGAQTVGDFFDANSQYMGLCWAATPEEAVQQLCTGGCEGGGGGGGSVSSSGGSAQVKDKTFEHCIRRICAATDSVFLVENNAAVLFPYIDWMAFTLRHKIGQIKAKDMDPDLFEINYNTDGFYNKVTVVWGADEEQDKTTSEQENEEDKKKVGNVTTIQKSMPTGGTQLSEQYDPLVKIYGELEKKVTTNFPNEETAHFVMNALLIQYIRDFNNSCRCRVINNQKFVGGTFYAVEDPNTKESELFYLNSYTMFKDKKQPLVTDMEFKYGPEGAEELLDYQSYGGGGGGAISGQSGAPTDEPQEIKELVAQICQGITDPTQKMMAIHDYLRQLIHYEGYPDSHYNNAKDCLTNAGHLNCADTSRLTRSCMGAAGLDAEVVYNSEGVGHYWTIIKIGSTVYASDAVHSSHEINQVWRPSGTATFTDGGPYEKSCGLNPCS